MDRVISEPLLPLCRTQDYKPSHPKDAVDRVISEHDLSHAQPCRTQDYKVEGARDYHQNLAIELCQQYGFDAEVFC